MLQKLKRWISGAVAVAMLSCLLPIQAFADGGAEYEELNDGYIAVKVSSKNGGFLIDTVKGDKLNKSDNNKFLLFPDENYDTSYTTFRVTRGSEVKDYIFGRKYGFLGKDSSGVTLEKKDDTITAKWSADGMTFTQSITLANTASPLHGMVSVSYGVQSADGRAADNVKARIMLDTALGYQDYAVYELTKTDSTYQQVRQEALIDNSDGTAYNNVLFGYDDAKSPSVTAYTVNASVDNKIVKPYQLAFGHWNNLAATAFDFTPDPSLTFTNPYNEKYLTADSAYALYFDMGSVAADGTANTISTNYGVYSNASVNNENKVSVNFSAELEAMQLTAEKDAYTSQISGGVNGDFTVSAQIKNISEDEMKQVAVAVYPQEGITPYDLSGKLDPTASYSDPYFVNIVDFNPGEERQVVFKLNAEPLNATDYRKIELRCFDVSGTDGKLLSENVLGSRSIYLLCPGAAGDRVSFLSATPEIIYNSGTRHLYLAGQNFNLLKNKAEYDVKLQPANGSQSLMVNSENFILDTENNTADLVLDQSMDTGTYQVVFDMKDPAKKDITSETLRFLVSDDIAYQGGSYGVVTIEHAGSDRYALKAYRNEEDYKSKVQDAQNVVLLEFRGDFTLKYDQGKLIEAEAVSLETVDHKAKSTINISDCLDVEKGTVTISVENPDTDEQTIDVDIDGEVYTTGARTKVWSGVCAISSFENGSESTLLQYDESGEPTNDVENSVANTNGITLMWPGAASTAQTIAGMIMEFRYCQFGQMALQDGPVTPSTPKKRIIAFGAQLSPDFLLPSNYKWSERETSAMEAVQLKLAKSNYTPDQLRDVQERYANDQEAWEEAESGSLSLYIHDILFGGGFIGFNTSVEIGLPSYADGLPSIEGTLNLKVMNQEYTIGVEGSTDMMAFEMEAALRLRSHNGIPIPDKFYFYAGGFTPGINVDGFGIFWIKGAGGGIDNLYETIYPSSSVPPITLLLSGSFALFDVLSARGDVSISPRALSIGLSDVEIANITLLNYAGVECQWYPELRFAASIYLEILDIIEGQGSIVVEKDQLKNNYFWEGFASASVSIPKKIPLFGGTNIGSADLGVNAEKIWGALHVLKIDAGVTYYWGGDVDFAFGKYDAPEATIELQSIPIYHDSENDRTLYMSFTNNIHTLASNEGIALFGVTNASVSSQADKKLHTVNFGSYNNENGVLTITFDAPSQLMADTYAKAIVMDGYPLIWTDNTKPADDAQNANANAMVQWDETTGKATATITVTDPAQFNKNISVKTTTASGLTLYALSKLPTLDRIQAENNTLTWDGTSLEKFSSLAVYAVSADNVLYPLYKTDQNADIQKKTAAISIPENMPSGEYTIRAVGTTSDESANPIVDADTKLTYTNPNQPEAPQFTVRLGGDYSLDLSGLDSAKYDGYKINIYEVENGKNQLTVFHDLDIAKNTDGMLPSEITVGGQYTQTVAKDSNGNIVNANLLTEEQLKDCTTESQQLGLFGGKQYVVGVRGYKNPDIASAETLSAPIAMTEPKKANVVLKAEDSVQVNDTDTVKNGNVSVSLTADMAVSGTWSLDNGEQSGTIADKTTSSVISLTGVAEGTHKLTFKGENETQDGVVAQYLFTVDTLPPRLQISSPDNGGFFDSSVTVKGLSDPGATVWIGIGTQAPQQVTVGENGEFETTVTPDSLMAYQKLTVYAADAVGNQTAPVTLQLTNRALGNPDSTLALYINGEEYTNKKLAAGSTGQLSLKVKTGGKSITLNEDSAAANRVDWNITAVSGKAEIDENGVLTTDQNINGVLSVSLDNQSAYAVLGGSDTFMPENPSYTIPTDLTAAYGQTLSEVTFPTAENGAWSWVEPNTVVGDIGQHVFKARFTPSDTVNYNTVTADITITVLPATPTIATAPTAAKITPGSKLSTSAISGGVVKGINDTELEGVWNWENDRDMTETGTFTETAVFTPLDPNYAPIKAELSVTVARTSSGGGGGGGGTPSYIVTFEVNGGSLVKRQSVSRNDTVTKPENPTKEGYTFAGWFTDAEGTTEYDFASRVTKSMTLYAKWTENAVMPTPTPTPTEPGAWKNPFTDVHESDWFYSSVKYANENGLMKGTTDTLFAPDEDITRAMFVTVLYRIEKEPQAAAVGFSDIESGSYYENAVAWAAENGIVKGISDTEFAPNAHITREQMAAIAFRYAQFKGHDTAISGELSYTDNSSVSDWAKDAVIWAAEKEIMSGNTDGSFAPAANTTRAQAAAVFIRILEKLN